jgi:hypothetical protein
VKFLLESQDTLREVHYIHILISPTRLDTIGLSSPSGDGSSKVAAGTRSGNQELRIYCSVYNSGKLSQLLSQKVLLKWSSMRHSTVSNSGNATEKKKTLSRGKVKR